MKYKIVPSNLCPATGKLIEDLKNDPNYLCLVVINPFDEQVKVFLDEFIDEFGANSEAYLKYHRKVPTKYPGKGTGKSLIANYIRPYLIGPASPEVITDLNQGLICGFFFRLDTKEIILAALNTKNAEEYKENNTLSDLTEFRFSERAFIGEYGAFLQNIKLQISKLPESSRPFGLKLGTTQQALLHSHTRQAVNTLLTIANVNSLTIENNQHLDLFSEGLEKTKVPNLNLSSNILGLTGALALSRNKAIRRIDLRRCTFLGNAWKVSLILKNENLLSIDLRFIAGIIPKEISSLASLPKLRSISIGSNNETVWTERFNNSDLEPLLSNYRLAHLDIPTNGSVTDEMKVKFEEHLKQNTIAMRQLFINQMLAVIVSSSIDNPFSKLPTDLLKLIFDFVGQDVHVLNPNVKTRAIHLTCSNAREKVAGKRQWKTTITLSDKVHTVFQKWSTENGAKKAEERYKLAIAQEREIIESNRGLPDLSG